MCVSENSITTSLANRSHRGGQRGCTWREKEGNSDREAGNRSCYANLLHARREPDFKNGGCGWRAASTAEQNPFSEASNKLEVWTPNYTPISTMSLEHVTINGSRRLHSKQRSAQTRKGRSAVR